MISQAAKQEMASLQLQLQELHSGFVSGTRDLISVLMQAASQNKVAPNSGTEDKQAGEGDASPPPRL
jgi:hypothetical protein